MVYEILPKSDEVEKWLIASLQHSCHNEYFLKALDLGKNDPERPHDLVGPNNKYEWNIIKGFALQYRRPMPDFKNYIEPSLELHRLQYHHLKWNNPDPNDITKPIPGASDEDMCMGAIDAICSLLENRGYQGGSHDYDHVIKIAKKNPPHKTPWMLKMIPKMRASPQPKLELIASLNDFPNIGLDKNIYDTIVKRTHETVEMLRNEHGYFL
jgi:hypothetical protein